MIFVDYRARLDRALNSVRSEAVIRLVEVVEDARANGTRLWLIGNGGSATTADHFATDLVRCCDLTGRPVRAMSLCSNVGIITATSNDLGYEQIFTRQLTMVATPRDVLVAISASGNSPNILAAIEWAKAHSLTTVGLTGFTGGLARSMVDVPVHVESAHGDYGVVEDAHLAVCHMAAEALRVPDSPPYAQRGDK